LWTGQLPALAGLGALGHLDLDVVGVGQVHRRDAEAAGGDLLDRRAPLRVQQALGVLAALTGVRAAPSRFIAIARVSCASMLIEP
jgi:hypothetical protein